MKKNIKIILSYDGTRFFGWEHQKNKALTIQGKLENVLYRMLIKEKYKDESFISKESLNDITGSFDDQRINGIDFKIPTVIGAGRTDAGVSARAMAANFIIDTDMSLSEIKGYMNKYLPDDIAIDEIYLMDDNFHSRFNAKGKTYIYTCYAGESKPIFDRKYVNILYAKPDIEKMRRAAAFLKGEHDFKSFCGNSHMKKSTIRRIYSIDIEEKDGYIRFIYHGNGFLQNMVRIMTGTLLDIGLGKIEEGDMESILAAKDRKKAGHTAMPQGLMLYSVDY